MADQEGAGGSKSGVLEGVGPVGKPASKPKAQENSSSPPKAKPAASEKAPTRKAVPASAKKSEGKPPKGKAAAPPEDDGPSAVVEKLERYKLPFIVYTVSIVLHGILLLLLGLIVIDNPIGREMLAIISNQPEEAEKEAMEEMTESEDIVDLQTTEDVPQDVAQQMVNETPQPLSFDTVKDIEPSMTMERFDLGAGPNVKFAEEFGGRTPSGRANAVKKNGGNEASEKAVLSGLKWIASVQHPDGSWDFADIGKNSQPGTMEGGGGKTGATGLALLAFLGAGHTHVSKNEKGEPTLYSKTVEKGLQFLLKTMQITPEGGDLRAGTTGHEGMYIQGICTIALCEAYAMTPVKEKYRKNLKQASEYALMFIVRAQDPKGGGWRYQPRQPGDTSVVGWQLMALVSGKAGGLAVPNRTLDGATYFLNSVTKDGSTYGYTGPEGKASTTAVGLLCRMYLEKEKFAKNQGYVGGIEYLSKVGPARNDMYYNYYATQVMHHWGGEEWKKWNAVMRDQLVKTQIQQGTEEGSWNLADAHGGKGGRLYMTCLAVMTLEVYYRHLPIYKRQNVIAEDV